MVWLAGIIVILLLIFSGAFRKVALGTSAVIAVGIGIFILVSKEYERESRARISVKDLDFQDIRLEGGYGPYRITGRIKNNSRQHTLTELGMNFAFEDCEKDNPPLNCVTIGETTQNFYLRIPAGQARDLSGYVFSGSTRAKGKMTWHYSISYTKGQ